MNNFAEYFLPNDQKMDVCQVFYINLDWNVE